MKILAGLFATCLVAMPVYAQGDPAPGADTGKPAAGSEPPADDAATTGTAADAVKPSRPRPSRRKPRKASRPTSRPSRPPARRKADRANPPDSTALPL